MLQAGRCKMGTGSTSSRIEGFKCMNGSSQMVFNWYEARICWKSSLSYPVKDDLHLKLLSGKWNAIMSRAGDWLTKSVLLTTFTKNESPEYQKLGIIFYIWGRAMHITYIFPFSVAPLRYQRLEPKPGMGRGHLILQIEHPLSERLGDQKCSSFHIFFRV